MYKKVLADLEKYHPSTFPRGHKSLASAAGTADPKTHRLAAAREEHWLDNRHALHATGTTRHS